MKTTHLNNECLTHVLKLHFVRYVTPMYYCYWFFSMQWYLFYRLRFFPAAIMQVDNIIFFSFSSFREFPPSLSFLFYPSKQCSGSLDVHRKQGRKQQLRVRRVHLHPFRGEYKDHCLLQREDGHHEGWGSGRQAGGTIF